MRITHNMMYNSMSKNMNTILSDYMNYGIQMSTQKRVNNPSDDPTGTMHILNYRASININATYIDNSKEARAWLKSTDGALQQAQTVLTRITELAEQASSQTYSPENRMQIATELRQNFELLMNIANTEYNGTHIFSGHKTDSPAYTKKLGVMTESAEFNKAIFDVQGELPQTAMIRFPQDGEIGGANDLTYEYSKDGGKTWVTKTLAAGDTTLNLDGCLVNMTLPEAVPPTNPPTAAPVQVTAYNPDAETSPSNGSMLYIRPSAHYIGDDNDFPPEVDVYGDSIGSADAQGIFKSDVQIKFPDDVSVGQDGTIEFQYSKDNGLTWETGKATTSAGSTSVRVVIPGGYVDVEAKNGVSIDAGSQFVVRPNRAEEQGYEIAPGDFVHITNDGKDIFGGLYQAKGSNHATPVEEPNIFETISDLIAYCETNNSDGCGQSVEDLRKMSEHLVTKLANIGGRSNRVEANLTVMQTHQLNQQERMSNIEDIDLPTLLNNIKKQQVMYQGVLQTSSMIMNLSLLNYI